MEVASPAEADDAETVAAVGRYAEALSAYRDRRFEEAAAKFREAGAALGGDVSSERMAARCDEYTAAGNDSLPDLGSIRATDAGLRIIAGCRDGGPAAQRQQPLGLRIRRAEEAI